jgi:hypothetical protein
MCSGVAREGRLTRGGHSSSNTGPALGKRRVGAMGLRQERLQTSSRRSRSTCGCAISKSKDQLRAALDIGLFSLQYRILTKKLPRGLAYLLQLVETLARECERIGAVLEESRSSANMAMKVQILTMLDLIFTPMSEFSGAWGMYVKKSGRARDLGGFRFQRRRH